MLISDFNRGKDEGINKAWQVAFDHWPWLELKSTIVQNAIIGIVFGLLFSLVVLIVLSRNIIISFISIFAISMIIL